MKFMDLRVGDVMELAGTKAVVMAITKPHPLNSAFWLIIWYIFDEGQFSFDMLHPDYELIAGSRVYKDGLVSWEYAAGGGMRKRS